MRAIHYNALAAQYWFLRSRAQFAGLFGGIGSGKSHAGCFWALLKALRNPHCLGLIGANSYHQLEDATLRTFRRLLGEYGIAHRFNASDMRFRLANGAVVLCRSMENYDSLRGVELGWFYLDELRDTRLEAWRVVQGRLRATNVDAREGRVTTSPNGFNWIYDEFIRRPSGDPEAGRLYEAVFARTADNHHLPPDYVAALAASYDPFLAAQELDGRFINTTAGRIYHAFDRSLHVSPDADFIPGAPVLWALDFNVTPMTAIIAQWEPVAAPPSGGPAEDRAEAGRGTGLRVVDEIWLADSGTMGMCEEFARRLEARGLGSAALRVYGDAAGRARSTAGKSDYAIIRQCFPHATLCVPAANPPRRDRYNAVNAALCNALGRVRLRIHPRCQKLIADLEQVVYQPGTGLPDASNPLLGHISDALGYLLARVMPAGRAGVTVGRW